MLSLLTPLSIGAAASALSSVADAIPTPGDFAAMLQRTGEASKSQAFEEKSEDIVAATETIGTRSELRRLLNDIEKSLTKLFGRNNVDDDKPIRLTLDGADGVKVEGDHPDAAAINELLAGDKELSAAVTQALKSINAATSPELLGGISMNRATIGEPKLTLLDGSLTPSLG